VLDGDGGSTTINTPSFTINNVNPQAAIVGAPASIDQGEEVELTSTASDVSSEDEAATLGYSWTVKRGDTLVETGSATDLSFTPTVAGTYTVTLVVTDKNGGATTTTKSIVATNLAPHSADISGMPTTLIEGESTTLTASASDVAGDTLTYSWNVLRNGVQFSEAAGKTFAFNPNIRGNFDVTMTATDVSGATSSKTIELTVGNVAPVVSATAPAETLLLGEAANFKLTFSDVPPSQGFTATWNFGDGTTSNNVYTSASTDLPRSHTYTAAGTYTMSVKISDGVDETVVTKTIVVSHAAIRTDALDANKKALYVYGTAAADNIKVEPGASSGLLKVTMNGTVLGTSFSQADRVIIEGRGGQNSIVVDGNVDTLVYAGQAGSAVTTSSGNDIIIGSSGADALNGRQGRDILIGQNGKDVFYGGDSEDLIVADIVNMTTASITKLVSQWGGDKTLAQRINDVRISGVFAAGKITNDGVQDNLFGELKGDWMLLNTSIDRLRDYVASADVIN
ncbi:MAG TPA: PKD domain-containing protein, partial [Tepidisphaeraceae bacterium]